MLKKAMISAAVLIVIQGCGFSEKKSVPDKPMGTAEAIRYFEKEKKEGTSVTVKGYVWGVRDGKKEGKVVAIADETISGVKKAPFLCFFESGNATAVAALKRDEIIVVQGKISKVNDAVILSDCNLLVVNE